MNLGLVDVEVRAPGGDPLPGVVVRAYSQDRGELLVHNVTDESGRTEFLLPADWAIQVRFFQLGVAFPSPHRFVVRPEPEPNVISIVGEALSPLLPRDPHLCVAWGFFRSITGAADRDVAIHFVNSHQPILVNGAAVVSERATVRSDKHGYVEVTLIRGGRYDVTIAGLEDVALPIVVPNAPTVRLPDLLFPVLESVRWPSPGPVELRVGEEVSLRPTLEWTNGERREGPAIDKLHWSSSDAGVVEVLPAGDALVLRGIAPGEANVLAELWRHPILRVPDPPLAGLPLRVRVT